MQRQFRYSLFALMCCVASAQQVTNATSSTKLATPTTTKVSTTNVARTTSTTVKLTTSASKPISTAVSCPVGSYRNVSLNTCAQCTVCGVGQFVSTQCGVSNNAVCRPCRAGYACATSGVEVACTSGYFSGVSSIACSSCPVNMYSDLTAVSACKQCPANSRSLVNSVTLLQCNCNSGFYRDADYNCVVCPVGSMCYANIITACSPGHFSNTTALATCSDCDYGTFQPLLGASSCVTCFAGKTVLQTTTSTEFPLPVRRDRTRSESGNVYVMRNYFILAQGNNLTKWSFYSIKSECAVTPAIFRADVNGNSFGESSWFTL